MNNPYEKSHKENPTESERISEDWAQEQREERRYQRELHADPYVNWAEAPKVPPKKKHVNPVTIQMNLFA